jgi:hypothetical protein
MENVLLIATVPAEYSESDKAIMRECIFNAGLIGDIHSEKLQFTTERKFNFYYVFNDEILTELFFKINIAEAAAIYCMHSSLKEHELAKPGSMFKVFIEQFIKYIILKYQILFHSLLIKQTSWSLTVAVVR